MERGVGSIWCLLPLVAGLLSVCYSAEYPTIVIDVYTRNSTLPSEDSVPLGTQLLLVCQVVGLPYGTPLSYTWTCPNGPCELEGYYGRKVYNEHILAVNVTTSTSDGGTYTCQVTAARGQEANESFSLNVNGGRVVHSYGRLIPHEFPITDIKQISDPDGRGRINCTDSSGTANFVRPGAGLGSGVTQTMNGATATLVVSRSNASGFQLHCTNSATNFFSLSMSSADPLSVPSITINTATITDGEYQVEGSDTNTTRVITGYEVFYFGVPMIGEYVNAGRGRTVPVSSVVPGAQYRITAWALDDGTRRSVTPAVKSVTAGDERPSPPRHLTVTRVIDDGLELNWLPPTEPNGEVLHYVIYYTPEGGTEQSNDTGSNLTHYNLTGLERNRVYTNIAVQAVNSADKSDRSAVIVQYNHTPSDATNPPISTSSDSVVIITGVSLLVVLLLLLSLVGAVLAVVVKARRKKKGKETVKSETKVKDASFEMEGATDTIKMYQNESSQPTLASGYNEYDYATTEEAFKNPASATTSFNTNVYASADYSEVDQMPSDAGGKVSGEQKKSNAKKTSTKVVNPEELYTQPNKTNQNKTSVKVVNPEELYTQPNKTNQKKANTEVVNTEELYTQPDRTKDKNKRTSKTGSEAKATPPDDLYAQPDMTKKKDKRSQQHLEQEDEEEKFAPTASLPYKKHKESEQVGDGDEADTPETPPPYAPVGEQYYNTRGGPLPQGSNYDYAVVDRQQK